MSDNHHTDKFEELCAGYVLNALDPGERKEFEDMLREASDEQQNLFLDLQSAANQLSFTMERTEPTGSVKEQLMEYVHSRKKSHEDTISPSGSGASVEEEDKDEDGDNMTSFAVAASFALLIISLSLLFYSFSLSSQLGEKEQVIESQQVRINSLQNEIEQKNELLSILESREVNMVLMAGMEANPKGYGKIIWDPGQNRALLQVSNLPAVPSDKDYQLWIIKNNQPVSAGVFAVHDPGRDAFFKIEQMDTAANQSASAFAVTLEPKGGMTQPTGDVYLMGNTNRD